MNLTRIIEETGKRVRLGKRQADKLTNAQVKIVLETALNVLQEALITERRVEIQGFAVIEVCETVVKKGGQLKPFGSPTQVLKTGTRQRWIFRPSQKLRRAVQKTVGL